MTLDKPNFVIIGAQKAGTTSLYHYLKQHPEVFMCRGKEPRFFSYLAQVDADASYAGDRAVKTLDAYRHLFAEATAKAVGEASVAYLAVPGTLTHMKRYIPRARLIAVLRNPADRAYSQYLMHVRQGKEQASFEAAVAAGRYLQNGFYYKNLAPFYEQYGADKMAVYLYEDLREAPLALLQHLFRFLEIDDTFVPDLTVRHNLGGRPRSRWVARLYARPPIQRFKRALKHNAPSWLTRLGIRLKNLNYTYPPMPPAVRQHLTAIYESDIIALEQLIDRDLGAWRNLDEVRVPAPHYQAG